MSNVYKKMLDGATEPYLEQKDINFDFEDYINGRTIFSQTSGCVYRNVVFKDGVPDKLLNPPEKSWETSFRGDTFRNVLHIFYGKAHVSKDCDTVYRITDKGIWQNMRQIKRDVLNTFIFRDLFTYFDEKYLKLFTYSLGFFNKACGEFFDEIDKIEDDNQRLKILKDMSILKKYFNSKSDLLKNNVEPIKKKKPLLLLFKRFLNKIFKLNKS